MAAVTVEGTLWVELADVFSWAETACGIPTAGVTGIFFSVDEEALGLRFSEERTVYIPSVDLWTWLINTQLPKGLASCETAFGVPVMNGPDLQMSFAASSEGDPWNWLHPPACLAEWTPRAPSGSAANLSPAVRP